MKKIKILQIVPNMQQGGLENLVLHIMRNLNQEKFEIPFLYHYNKDYFFDKEIEELGGIIHKCTFREDHNLFKYIKFLKDLFSKNKKNVFPKLHWLAEKFNDYCIVNKHSHRINLDQLTLEDEQ